MWMLLLFSLSLYRQFFFRFCLILSDRIVSHTRFLLILDEEKKEIRYTHENISIRINFLLYLSRGLQFNLVFCKIFRYCYCVFLLAIVAKDWFMVKSKWYRRTHQTSTERKTYRPTIGNRIVQYIYYYSGVVAIYCDSFFLVLCSFMLLSEKQQQRNRKFVPLLRCAPVWVNIISEKVFTTSKKTNPVVFKSKRSHLLAYIAKCTFLRRFFILVIQIEKKILNLNQQIYKLEPNVLGIGHIKYG